MDAVEKVVVRSQVLEPDCLGLNTRPIFLNCGPGESNFTFQTIYPIEGLGLRLDDIVCAKCSDLCLVHSKHSFINAGLLILLTSIHK